MKTAILKIFTILAAIVLLCPGCEDYLTEKPKGDLTTDLVYSTPDGYERLVASCYIPLRNVSKYSPMAISGTDLFTVNADEGNSDLMNDYTALSFNTTNGMIDMWWKILYKGVQWCNTAIERADGVEGGVEETIKTRRAEAVFLKNFYYFFLVQSFGDIPYRDYEVSSPETDISRTPEADVYAGMIADLEAIKEDLPKKASLSGADEGRVCWEACRQLLAEIYLTRGWDYNGKLGGSDKDFKLAAQYADDVISSMGALQGNSADSFFPDGDWTKDGYDASSDKNSEIIFSFRFSSDRSSNTEIWNSSGDNSVGSNMHYMLTAGISTTWYGILDINSMYGAGGGGNVPTSYAYEILHPEMKGFDKRANTFFNDAIIAEVEEETKDGTKVFPGDTVVFIPGAEDGEVLADGTVINYDDYRINNPHIVIFSPTDIAEGNLCYSKDGLTEIRARFFFWKFFEPYNRYEDMGSKDMPYMRLAGSYLTAAEAYLMAGNKGRAAELYTAVRARSIDLSMSPTGKDPDARTAANITIDDILDERGRELSGEFHRWFDLKRTKTLYTRVPKYNTRVKKAGELEKDASVGKYLLRPIPDNEIQRVTNPDFKQNPGYLI